MNGNQIIIQKDRIFIHLPHTKMKYYGGCGAAASCSIGKYYGFGPQTEKEWWKILKTKQDGGTPPRNITKIYRKYGLKVDLKKNLGLENLFIQVEKGKPVICPIQAYGSYWDYNTAFSGHYVIVIGFDEKYVFLEDSNIAGMRGYTTHHKFLSRWYDVDREGRYYEELGLIISGREVVKEKKMYKAQRIW